MAASEDAVEVSFEQAVSGLEDGRVSREADEALHEIALKCSALFDEYGAKAKGQVAVVIDLVASDGFLTISAHCKTKWPGAPKAAAGRALMRDDPRQSRIDPETGEVIPFTGGSGMSAPLPSPISPAPLSAPSPAGGGVPITAAHVIGVVCQRYRIMPAQIWGVSRRAGIVRPRHVAMTIAIEMTGLSINALARVFGRDHSTLINARRRIHELAARDQELAVLMAAIRASVRLRAMRDAEDAEQARAGLIEAQIEDCGDPRSNARGLVIDRGRVIAGDLTRRRAHEPRGRVFRARLCARGAMQ
ncbi:MAG: hypothetical protein MRY63_04305 [Neomegalonema sp.]|nr:hypothetical protein [Neomegalonema sp.]